MRKQTKVETLVSSSSPPSGAIMLPPTWQGLPFSINEVLVRSVEILHLQSQTK